MRIELVMEQAGADPLGQPYQAEISRWDMEVPLSEGRWERILPFDNSHRRIRLVVHGVAPVPDTPEELTA